MLLPGTFLQESYENDDLVDNVTSAFRNSCNSHDIFIGIIPTDILTNAEVVYCLFSCCTISPHCINET